MAINQERNFWSFYPNEWVNLCPESQSFKTRPGPF